MSVLDASALLAYLDNEPGASTVRATLIQGATIHHVNWAEVLSKRAERGENPKAVMERLERLGLIGQLLTVDRGQPQDELEVARLRPLTRAQGLSLGDRFCLALALRLGQEAITSDKNWASVSVGVTVQVIR